jgi:hypothetical protein
MRDLLVSLRRWREQVRLLRHLIRRPGGDCLRPLLTEAIDNYTAVFGLCQDRLGWSAARRRVYG